MIRLGALGLGLAFLVLGAALAQEREPGQGGPGFAAEDVPVLRDGFESPEPSWREEDNPTDASLLLRVHDRSDEMAHDGRRAERWTFDVGPGSALYYSYSLPKIPITKDLRASLYVRSNRVGVRIYGHVVLPADRDPERGEPSFLLVPGTANDTPDRWQRIELSDLPLAIERQARVLRAGTHRPVRLEGAYLDRLVINLYGGPGESEVWVDDLVVSPVSDELADGSESEPAEGRPEPARPRRAGAVEFRGNYLKKDGQPWFPRAVAAPGADPGSLRRAGFDVLAVPARIDADDARRVAEMGYQLMPTLAAPAGTDPETIGATAATFPIASAVAFWDLGLELGRADDPATRGRELNWARRVVQSIHRASGASAAPVLGAVSDLFPQYALFGRNLDIIGVEPPGIGSAYEPLEIEQFLLQRRRMTATRNPNALFWAWIPASAPAVLRRSVWGDDVPPSWGWPTVSPDQLRMFTYAALAAGYRGLGFRGDAELGRPGGLDRLYELTLLLAEIELLEPILARGADPIVHWPVFPPDPEIPLVYNSSGMAGGFSNTGRNSGTKKIDTREVRALPNVIAAAIDSEDGRSKLLVVVDLAAGGQWQPPQMGYKKLRLLVPAPESAQAYEINPGECRPLESRREAGGRRITLPLFQGTALVLLTTDESAVEPIRSQVDRIRPRAADIAIKQAELRLEEASRLNGLLAQRGVRARDAEDLLAEARSMIDSARDALNRQDFAAAWGEARRVGQPIRMVLNALWYDAVVDYQAAVSAAMAAEAARDGARERPAPLASPVGCPPLLCARTLPHYYNPDWHGILHSEAGTFGPNQLMSGGFEATPAAMRAEGWVDASHPVEGLTGAIRIDARGGWGPTSKALKLSVAPTQQVDPEQFRGPDGQPDAKAVERARKAITDALPPALAYPVAAIRSPAVPVRAGDLVRIRVLAKMPRQVPAGGAGLIVRDSLGGEALQFRNAAPMTAWREIVLHRRAPEDGELTVLFGLAGQGEAYFDDLRIEVRRADGPTPRRQPDDEPLADRGPAGPSVPSARLPGERGAIR
jgi:hypothetical protein